MTKGPVIAVVVGLLAVGIAAQPYMTVRQLRAAAERRDGAAFSEFIDFPSVRQSLKDQINAAFLREMTKDGGAQQNGAAVLGAIGGVIVDRAAEAFLEAYVTPAGITQMMAGNQSDSDGHDTDDKIGCQPMAGGSMSYESLNKFVVSAGGDVGRECGIVLRRQGIGWKVTEFIIPLGQLGEDDSGESNASQKLPKASKSPGN